MQSAVCIILLLGLMFTFVVEGAEGHRGNLRSIEMISSFIICKHKNDQINAI